MTTPPTGWREITRTRFLIGQCHFPFVGGPAAGEQLLNVGTERIPAAYAILGHADVGEVIYMRRGTPDRWHFEYIRTIYPTAGSHITCPACSRTTHHLQNIQQGWCSACHAYTQLGADETATLGELVASNAARAEIRSGAETYDQEASGRRR